jgi:hypothetical protein
LREVALRRTDISKIAIVLGPLAFATSAVAQPNLIAGAHRSAILWLAFGGLATAGAAKLAGSGAGLTQHWRLSAPLFPPFAAPTLFRFAFWGELADRLSLRRAEPPPPPPPASPYALPARVSVALAAAARARK